MSDIAWPSISNASVAPHNFGRGMTATAEMPMLFIALAAKGRFAGDVGMTRDLVEGGGTR